MRGMEPIFFTPPPTKWDRRLWKDSPSPPAAPDPQATAAAQTGQNQATAYFNAALNRPTQVTPYGTSTWTNSGGGPQYNMPAYNQAMQAYQDSIKNLPARAQTGTDESGQPIYAGGSPVIPAPPSMDQFKIGDSPGQWTNTISFNPQQQRIFDLSQTNKEQLAQLGTDQLGRIKESVAKPYDLSAAPAAPVPDQAWRQQVLDSQMQLLQPYFDRDRAALSTKLANQGFADENANYARDQKMQLEDNITRARLNALASSGQEMSRMFDLGSQAHQTGVADYERERYAPLNEYNAFQSGSQITTPQFASTFSPVASAPANYAQYAQNAYGGAQDAYNQQVATNNANTSAGTSLATAAILAMALSDERLKTDIEPAGKVNEFNWYRFRYVWDEPGTIREGVMAQEVQEVMPDAVGVHPSGFLMVDYGKVLHV